MSITIQNFDNYINQQKKIFTHQLNSNPYTKPKPNKKKQKFFNNDEEEDEDDDEDDDDDKPQEMIEIIEKKISNNDFIIEDVDTDIDIDKDLDDEKNELYHLNISHLNLNNDWVENNYYLNSEHETNDFVSHLKNTYLDQSNGLKKSVDIDKYKVISETCKIKLDEGTINNKSSGYISSTLLNQSKLYDGMTHLSILTNPKTNPISSVKIRTRAKDKELINPTYRNILWDLEFEECDEGYRILGLDNFIHISLVGLEEIFLDIEYMVEGTQDLRLGWLKFDRCYYNSIIKTNLAAHLYENEETYSVDIIDWIVREFIDINQQEHMYKNIYGTNYNILRIMGGMGGICYSN